MRTPEPYNWCDRRCERCPLRGECRLARYEEQQDWVAQARGEDPEDPAYAGRRMAESVERSMRLLEIAAEEEGIDLSKPVPPIPRSLYSRRVRQALFEWVGMMTEELGSLTSAAETVQTTTNACLFVVIRMARVLPGLRADGGLEEDEAMHDHGALNLLIVEHYLAKVRSGVEVLGEAARGRVSDGLAEVERLLAPALDSVPAQVRADVGRLTSEGRAPSPFATVG